MAAGGGHAAEQRDEVGTEASNHSDLCSVCSGALSLATKHLKNCRDWGWGAEGELGKFWQLFLKLTVWVTEHRLQWLGRKLLGPFGIVPQLPFPYLWGRRKELSFLGLSFVLTSCLRERCQETMLQSEHLRSACHPPLLHHLPTQEHTQIPMQVFNPLRGGAGESVWLPLFLAFSTILYSTWMTTSEGES